MILKICNELLRRLPRDRVELCTVISQTVTAQLALFDRSGVNLRGDFAPAKEQCWFECIESVSQDFKDSQYFSLFKDCVQVFNEFCTNFSLLSNESQLVTLLQCTESIILHYSNAPQLPLTAEEDYEFGMAKVDYELFHTLIGTHSPSFARALCTRMTIFLQVLLHSLEFSFTATVPLLKNYERRLGEALQRMYALLGKCFGEGYCHLIKKILYSEKCRLKLKSLNFPAFEEKRAVLEPVQSGDFSIDAQMNLEHSNEHSNEHLSEHCSNTQVLDLGSEALNAIWNYSASSQGISTVEFLEPLVLDLEQNPDSEFKLSCNFGYVWRALRLIIEDGNGEFLFNYADPIMNFDRLASDYYHKAKSEKGKE